jgi:hypothetical protein
MADVKDLFNQGEDVTDIFNKGEAVKGTDTPYSATGAAALGAAKGATFGFDDEIAGLAKGLIDKGVGSKKDFWDIYKDVRDSVRAEHAKAEEQHPVASFAGELAGGVIPMALAPEGLIGAGAAEGAGFLGKAKAMATTGAKVGALAGLGGSNADLTQGDVMGAAKDTATGAASGAVLGAASQALGSTVGKVAGIGNEYAKQFPIYNEVQRTFNKAAAGESLAGKANVTTQAANDAAKSLSGTLETMRGESGAARQLAIDAASDTGIKVDPHAWADKWIAEAEAQLPKANETDKASINDFIKQVKNHVGEKTEDVDQYIPLESGLTPDQMAVESNRAKMGTKALGDTEQAAQVTKSLYDDIESGKIDINNPDHAQTIIDRYNKAKALAAGNIWSPEVQKDAETGVEAIVSPRGANKAPVVSQIKQNPFEAQVAHVMGQATTRDVDTLTPAQVDKIATDLNSEYRALGPQQGRVRNLYGGAKQDLQKQMADAANMAPSAKQDAVDAFNKAIEDYKGETGDFGTVAGTQTMLGQPGYSSVTEGPDKTLKLQNMIQNYNKPGSQSRMILDQAMNKLSDAYPEAVPAIRNMIVDAASNRDIALGLANQSPLATNLLHASAKAVTMNIADLGGRAYGGILRMGGGTAGNISKSMTDIGKHIYDFTPDQTRDLANYVIKKGGTFASTLGKPLQEAVNASQGKRRALLFALMQQPDFRNVAGQFMSNNEESP